MGRKELRRRDLGIMDHPSDQVKPALTVSQVDIYDPRLSREHSRHSGVRCDSRKLFKRGLGRAVVRDCHLSHADHFVQHHDILHQTVRQRVHRHLIRAGVSICGDPFIFQGVGLCQQSGHIPADTVRADTAYYRCDPISDQIPQRSLRRPRVEAALSASSQDMLVAVDKSRHRRHVFPIDLLYLKGTAEVRPQMLSDCGDPVSQYKNVLHSGIFRLIDFCISDDRNH